jgi:WD40 repeat protein
VRATKLSKSEAAQRATADRLRAAQRELLYASEMAVCYRALDFGQVHRVRRILEEHRLDPPALDLRGWEWCYLWALTRPMELEVLRQPGFVTAVTYSPDGSRLALGYGGDGGIRLYDARNNRLLADQKIEFGVIETLAFTPSGEGLYLSLRSTHFLLLDSSNLGIRHRFTGHQQPVTAVVPESNGDFIVSSAGFLFGQEGDAETFVWDARQREILFKLPASASTGFLPRISGSGRYLSRGMNQGGAVEVWDLRERRKVIEFKAHQKITYATAFSPDETMLATCGDDGFVRLWNWRERLEIATLGRHTAPASEVAFSPDGQRLATCSLDSTVRIWDVAELREQSVLRGHRGRIHRLAFSPDGSRIASAGGPDQSVRLWNAASRGQDALLDTASQSTATAAFTPDGNEYCLLRVESDGSSTLKVWRSQPLPDGTHELISSARAAESLAMTVSGTNLVLMAAGSPEVVIQELLSGKQLRRLTSPIPLLGPITASQDGRWLAAFAISNHVVVLDAASGGPASVFQLPNAWETRQISGRGALLFSPISPKLWVAFPGAATVVCVDWQAPEYPTRLTGHTRGVLALAASPDGAIIATGSADMTARVWDAATGVQMAVLDGEHGAVTAVSFSPDGLTLATGYFDGPIKLWSLRARTELATFYPHISIVSSVLFSPDRKALASASYDGTARIWHAPLRGEADLTIRSRPRL